MDLETVLRDSWDKFIAELVALVLFVLVGGLLCITIILIPVVMAGMILGFTEYVRNGRKPEMSDLWSHWNKFVPVLLFLIVSGILISIGFALIVLPGIFLMTIWLYAIYFIVDKDMNLWEAMETSRKAVMAQGFWMHLVILLLTGLLSSVGAAIAGIGALFTAPLAMLILTRAYLEVEKAQF